MRVRLLVFMIILAALALPAFAEFEEFTVTNSGFSRTISGTENLLKTTKIFANGVQILAQPSVEFMIDLSFKGKMITLVPSDFNIKAQDSVVRNRETCDRIELHCTYEGLPLIVYVDYFSDPRFNYQAKSITISPCKEAAGAVIKRVVIDYFQLNKEFLPLTFGLKPVTSSGIGAIDSKSGKGIYFLALGQGAKALCDDSHNMVILEDTNTPVENGFQTGRAILCAAGGTPETLFSGYRQFLMNTYYGNLARDSKFTALKKHFASYFAVSQPVSLGSDNKLDGEAHIVDGKGMILLFNRLSEPVKAQLPLADALLALNGDLKLSDWSKLDKPEDMGAHKSTDKVEIEVPAGGFKIIGVNVED